jgi:hypothetical protein
MAQDPAADERAVRQDGAARGTLGVQGAAGQGAAEPLSLERLSTTVCVKAVEVFVRWYSAYPATSSPVRIS